MEKYLQLRAEEPQVAIVESRTETQSLVIPILVKILEVPHKVILCGLSPDICSCHTLILIHIFICCCLRQREGWQNSAKPCGKHGRSGRDQAIPWSRPWSSLNQGVFHRQLLHVGAVLREQCTKHKKTILYFQIWTKMLVYFCVWAKIKWRHIFRPQGKGNDRKEKIILQKHERFSQEEDVCSRLFFFYLLCSLNWLPSERMNSTKIWLFCPMGGFWAKIHLKRIFARIKIMLLSCYFC